MCSGNSWGDNCWWIIIAIILIWCCCGNGNGIFGGCGAVMPDCSCRDRCCDCCDDCRCNNNNGCGGCCR